MILSPARIEQRRQTGLLVSLGAHAAIFGVAFLFTLHWGKVQPVYRESRCCTAALYWSGNTGVSDSSPVSATHKRQPKTAPVPVPKTALIENPMRLRQPRTAEKPAQSRLAQSGNPTPQQQQSLGTGAGTDDAEPAFPTYFPRPPVTDRSLLPAVEHKIIVHVTISPLGDVTDEKLVQGIGNGLDDLVLKTVKGWRFHPATLNGNAVASVEDLVFPFSQDYPSDDNSANG
jgi:hypothetical protein